MTRSIVLAVLFALSTVVVGCAAEGTDSEVAVITAALEDQQFELVEMHDEDGFIDVDLYYAVGQAEEIAHESFRWPAAEPTPSALLERLRDVDPRLLADAHPLSDDSFETPTISIDRVWPRILQEVQLESRIVRPAGCPESIGLADCLAQP